MVVKVLNFIDMGTKLIDDIFNLKFICEKIFLTTVEYDTGILDWRFISAPILERSPVEFSNRNIWKVLGPIKCSVTMEI